MTAPPSLPDRRARLAALLVIVAIVAADQAVKQAMIGLGAAGSLPLAVTPFFNLVLGFNRGVTFGLLASDHPLAPYLLGGLACVVALGFWLLACRTPRPDERLGLTAVIGGALGNAVDRFHRGAVTDFLDFHLASWHWPAFNLADIAIVAGVVLLLVATWRASPVAPSIRLTVAALGVVLVAALAVIVFLVTAPVPAPPERIRRIADIGGAFTLTDHRGRTVTRDDFRGAPFIVFFGFTSCPDICPTALSYALTAIDALPPPVAAPIRILLVSVDPARDTPARLADYVAAFDDRVVGLTGTPRQIEAMAETYRAYYEKGPLDASGNYPIDHTGTIFLMDRTGSFAAALDVHEPIETATAKLAAVAARE